VKIAQVAPLYESVPPKLYGGTERVVSYLTDELVRQGHDVTLFASGDSVTRANLHSVCVRALRLEGKKIVDPLAHHMRMIEIVAQEAAEFDVVHFHVDYLHFSVTRRQKNINAVSTLHGRLDIPDLIPIYREFNDMNLVSISDAQRTPLVWANWIGTVYHGLPENLYVPRTGPGNYLAFLGRICPEKRVDHAIEIAKRVGIPIKIAAKVDVVDREYFESTIRKLLDHPLVEYIGEIGERDKNEFLGNARALLFPIDWPEPFGLVMIEAMACGTPVIAYQMGSVPEIIDDGTTGFIVNDLDGAVDAIDRVRSFDRTICRRVFEKRFSVRRMASDYVNIYKQVVEQNAPSPAMSVDDGFAFVA
jgi:glycosyltransferase involved in cell wall biosynthesis